LPITAAADMPATPSDGRAVVSQLLPDAVDLVPCALIVLPPPPAAPSLPRWLAPSADLLRSSVLFAPCHVSVLLLTSLARCPWSLLWTKPPLQPQREKADEPARDPKRRLVGRWRNVLDTQRFRCGSFT
jgi:hypothetical protein